MLFMCRLVLNCDIKEKEIHDNLLSGLSYGEL